MSVGLLYLCFIAAHTGAHDDFFFVDLKFSLEMKSAQLDSARERLAELEQQLVKRDETITLQKRMLKIVKEEHKEQFNVGLIRLTYWSSG